MRKSILALSLTSLLLAGGSIPFLSNTKATQDDGTYISEPESSYTVIEAWKEEVINFHTTERLTTWKPTPEWFDIYEPAPEPDPEPETILTEEEVLLIAKMTMAEAEGESELGKRLVIDTILNRVDSSHFPNTVSGVLFQPHQFSPIESGRWDRCWAREDICQLVLEECMQRQNYDCVYFQRARACSWGVWLFKEGNHNFFGYKEF